MPVDIVVRERGTAERMIESFMLAANECVAEHFAKAKLPFIYRIHEEPKAEKLQRFMDYASIFGVQIKGTANKMDQLDLQEFMAQVQGKPGAEVMNMMLLRSMQQARYSEHNHGHYGLAAQYYTHFTSPIRRYPDLLVHRMIREYTNNMSQETREHFEEVIPELATSSSTLERRAIDAERVVEAMKKRNTWKSLLVKNSTVLLEVWLNSVCLWNCQTPSKVWFTSPPFQNFTITMNVP